MWIEFKPKATLGITKNFIFYFMQGVYIFVFLQILFQFKTNQKQEKLQYNILLKNMKLCQKFDLDVLLAIFYKPKQLIFLT
jgi:hypothetical protein